ncbi:MAG TPA: DUF2283 domain-containing protein [Pseudonocardiaceae bacterium]|jgi:uncharacterized protein YuzE
MGGDSVAEFRVRWDETADAAYISLVPGSVAPDVASTLEVLDREGRTIAVLDLSADGELVGLEVLGASTLLAQALRTHLRNS